MVKPSRMVDLRVMARHDVHVDNSSLSRSTGRRKSFAGRLDFHAKIKMRKVP